MSPRHPAKRSRQARQVVQDSYDLAEWYATERAAARRDLAATRFLHAASWCVVALTATLIAAVLFDMARS